MSTSDLLSAIELKEMQLLSWGITSAAWARTELLSFVSDAGFSDPELTLQQLLDNGLVVSTPNGRLRSRMAETVRLMATLRQTFRGQAALAGTPLVLDFRLLHRERVRPRRDIDAREFLREMGDSLSGGQHRYLAALLPLQVSLFQVESCQQVAAALTEDVERAIMVAAGTGAGKTLAFYAPALSWIGSVKETDPNPAVRGLAIYPRKELLKDQISAVVRLLWSSQGTGGPSVRIGAWYGDTPGRLQDVRSRWRVWGRGSGEGWICPTIRCPGPHPEGEGTLIIRCEDVERDIERLHCAEGCGAILDSSTVALSRQSMARAPVDVLFTTAESLNRQLASSSGRRAFGVEGSSLRFVLLDEIHTFEGLAGAQVAYLMRRLKAALGPSPLLWGALSATLENPVGFLASLTGVSEDTVVVVQPQANELEAKGAEYGLALRHDPTGHTSPLSVTVQVSMLMARALDSSVGDNPFSSGSRKSGGVFGEKTFIFSDKLDVANRLYWALLDAEGWWSEGRRYADGRRPLTLAHIRSRLQTHVREVQREAPAARDALGQWWWLADATGHNLDGDNPTIVSRTSSQDTGVNREARLIAATASLEVGYDDPAVGTVIQHTAPRDAATFVQRRGRAGRNADMRPWSVVVLSSVGRDRVAWDLYEDMFDARLTPSRLPMENRHVLKMQAVYALMDWLSQRLRLRNVWELLSKPASHVGGDRSADYLQDQQRVQAVLERIMSGGSERELLAGYLRKCLGLTSGVKGDRDLHAILWDAPRPVLLAVVPTIWRRLRDQWAGETPAIDAPEVKFSLPLREFISGNLFDDLMVPDVLVRLPEAAGSSPEGDFLPVYRALEEFSPGNVSKHFGVKSESRRHWVPVDAGSSVLNVELTHGAVHLDSFEHADHRGRVERIFLTRPEAVTVVDPPREVRDASRTRLDWRSWLRPAGEGRDLSMPVDSWRVWCGSVRSHLHKDGGGVRIRRYATRARGRLFSGSAPTPVEVTFQHRLQGDGICALGAEMLVDGLSFVVSPPSEWPPVSSAERVARFRHLFGEDRSISDSYTDWDRDALASAFEALGASEALKGLPFPSSLTESSGDRAQQLALMIRRLGLAGSDPDDGGRVEEEETRQQAQAGIDDDEVLEALQSAWESSVRENRDEDWVIWALQRLGFAAAQVLIQAASRLNSHLDTESLAIDVQWDADASQWTVWITETSPGGIGQVEAMCRILGGSMTRFSSLVAAELQVGDLESVDDDIQAFLRWAATSEDAEALQDVRKGWAQGHEVISEALGEVRRSLEASGLSLSDLAWSIIANRLVGPGSSRELLPALESMLAARNEIEAATSFLCETRALACALSGQEEWDGALNIPADSSDFERSMRMASLLWPRGKGLESETQVPFDRFRLSLGSDMQLLRALTIPTDSTWSVSDRSDWGTDELADVKQALAEGKVVCLRFPSGASFARSIMLELLGEQIEVGYILAHPQIVGVDGEEGHWVSFRLTLEEVVNQ